MMGPPTAPILIEPTAALQELGRAVALAGEVVEAVRQLGAGAMTLPHFADTVCASVHGYELEAEIDPDRRWHALAPGLPEFFRSRRMTLATIGTRSGLSGSTVSRAFREPLNASPRTRAALTALWRELQREGVAV